MYVCSLHRCSVTHALIMRLQIARFVPKEGCCAVGFIRKDSAAKATLKSGAYNLSFDSAWGTAYWCALCVSP